MNVHGLVKVELTCKVTGRQQTEEQAYVTNRQFAKVVESFANSLDYTADWDGATLEIKGLSEDLIAIFPEMKKELTSAEWNVEDDDLDELFEALDEWDTLDTTEQQAIHWLITGLIINPCRDIFHRYLEAYERREEPQIIDHDDLSDYLREAVLENVEGSRKVVDDLETLGVTIDFSGYADTLINGGSMVIETYCPHLSNYVVINADDC